MFTQRCMSAVQAVARLASSRCEAAIARYRQPVVSRLEESICQDFTGLGATLACARASHCHIPCPERERHRHLAYCREVLLPIWERWTHADPVMRRALECHGVDPQVHERRCDDLFRAQRRMSERSSVPAYRAAALAAQACQYALLGYPRAIIAQVAEEALEANAAARASIVVVRMRRLVTD